MLLKENFDLGFDGGIDRKGKSSTIEVDNSVGHDEHAELQQEYAGDAEHYYTISDGQIE